MTKDDGRAQQRLGQCVAQGLVVFLRAAKAILLTKAIYSNCNITHDYTTSANVFSMRRK